VRLGREPFTKLDVRHRRMLGGRQRRTVGAPRTSRPGENGPGRRDGAARGRRFRRERHGGSRDPARLRSGLNWNRRAATTSGSRARSAPVTACSGWLRP